jgi:hypothetical protein
MSMITGLKRLSSTAVYGHNAFLVSDTGPDRVLWAKRERNPYFDAHVRQVVSAEIKPHLPLTGNIADLLTGYHTYVERTEGRLIHGVGLVAESLAGNPALDSFAVRDLNEEPAIELPGNFRTAVIAFGLPYLRQPLELLSALNRQVEQVIIYSSASHYETDKATAIWRLSQTEFGFGGIYSRSSLAVDFLRQSGFRVTAESESRALRACEIDAFLVVGERYFL